MCRQEAAQAPGPLVRSVLRHTHCERDISADLPDEDYPVTSPRVARSSMLVTSSRNREARRVEPAVAKLDAERPTLAELERSRPGPSSELTTGTCACSCGPSPQ